MGWLSQDRPGVKGTAVHYAHRASITPPPPCVWHPQPPLKPLLTLPSEPAALPMPQPPPPHRHSPHDKLSQSRVSQGPVIHRVFTESERRFQRPIKRFTAVV